MKRWMIGSSATVLVLTAAIVQGGEKSPSAKDVQAVRSKAIAYLKSAQNKDGSFAPELGGPGVTALVAAALLKNGVSDKDPMVARALEYLEKNVQKDGGIYSKGLANYVTSVAIMAFAEANTDGKYDTVIKNAATFLRKLQFDEPESLTSDVKFGGFGYDGKGRPDASNSNFSVEAMLAAGIAKDDPAFKNALVFLSRCQNLPGEHNDQPFAKKTTEDNKGGFTYVPTTDKNQYDAPDGGLRSLGGMTYGGLKSFLYAGVSKDDPRVKAALDWIARHYTLEENPGMGQGGLYYYYHTFAKAMDALGAETFTDAKGQKHNWRMELFQTLQKKQGDNGSWVNANMAFGESNPELCTAFALMALDYCETRKK
jgi:hypothetical protein